MHFHKGILALVLSVLLIAGLLLPGCGETAAATPTKAAAATAGAATPTKAAATTPGAVATPTAAAPAATPTKVAKPGGVLIFGQGTDTTASYATFDPAILGITGSMTAFDQCYENLFSRDPGTFNIVPQLGEKFEVAPDATSVTIYLRKGVKWHNVAPVNGREFTADDVKWNIERQANANPPLSTTSYYKRVKEIQIIDKYTIKLNLTAPYASITWLISDPNFVMYPRELLEQYGDKQMKAAIGTGPFMFKSYEAKVSIEFVKNPDYYIKGYPLLDGFKIVYIADAAAQLAAMRSGQVHMLWMRNATEKQTLESSVTGLQSRPHQGSPYILWMNNKVPPFNNIAVRKAVHLAVDRPALIQLVEQGSGQLMTNYNASQSDVYRTAAQLATVPGYRTPKTQDIADAKKLLADAGLASGVTVEAMLSPTVGNTLRANEVLKEQMAAVGINWQIKSVENTVASAELFKNPPVFNVLTAGVSNRPDNDKSNYYSTKSPTNVWGFGSPELDVIWDKAMAEGDQAKRTALYRQADDILLDLANTPPLYQTLQYVVADPKLRNWVSSANPASYWLTQQFKYAWFDK